MCLLFFKIYKSGLLCALSKHCLYGPVWFLLAHLAKGNVSFWIQATHLSILLQWQSKIVAPFIPFPPHFYISFLHIFIIGKFVLFLTCLNMHEISWCDQFCQWLSTGLWFFSTRLGTPVSSTNKTDCHDITEILLNGVKHHYFFSGNQKLLPLLSHSPLISIYLFYIYS
jgi:hypothetical protein